MRIEIVEWGRLDERGRAEALARPGVGDRRAVAVRVRRILASVRRGGDAALRRWTARLDGAELVRFEVGAEERRTAEAALGAAARAAIERAAEAIRAFHRAQLRPPLRVATWPGVECELVERPHESVGLYVPAGGAPLPSTALMLAVPASEAGCRDRVVVTPPRRDGTADPAVVVAAGIAGASRVLKLGGAQAVAALAYGSETVPRVDKIFGPGNAWVTEAKRQVAADPAGCAVDLPAGPSEMFVVADGGADPVWAAADLVAQAEHAPDAHVVLATPSRALARAVQRETARAAAALPRRAILERSLAGSRIVVTDSLEQAFRIAARYAPEHLLLAMDDAERWLENVGPAGAVYVGSTSAGSFGDYATGANHTLPAGGAARVAGGLSLADFRRVTTFQRVAPEGAAALAEVTATLARLEGLEGHARAAELRARREVRSEGVA